MDIPMGSPHLCQATKLLSTLVHGKNPWGNSQPNSYLFIHDKRGGLPLPWTYSGLCVIQRWSSHPWTLLMGYCSASLVWLPWRMFMETAICLVHLSSSLALLLENIAKGICSAGTLWKLLSVRLTPSCLQRDNTRLLRIFMVAQLESFKNFLFDSVNLCQPPKFG